MRMRFSLKATLIGLTLAAGMVRLSYWQWERHVAKKDLIASLDARLEKEPVPLQEILKSQAPSWSELVHSRVKVAGDYDFSHEVILKNRRYKGHAGVFVLTPLLIKDTSDYILVNRGFIPLEKSEQSLRTAFQQKKEVEFIGVVKESSPRRFLAPADPPAGPGLKWVDSWLRVDLAEMTKQLPYTPLPVWLEIINEPNIALAREQMIQISSHKDELLSLAQRDTTKVEPLLNTELPAPVYDIIIPAGRHLGYVFEWALMAIVTLMITFIVQLRR